MLSNKTRQQLFTPALALILLFWLAIGCGFPVASPIAEIATATPAPPLFTPTPLPPPTLMPPATPTPLPPPSTASPPTLTPPPLSCETHTAAVELSASATTLQVGQVVTISVTLRNQGCSQLGLPQYRLETTPSILNPAHPEPVTRALGILPELSDTAEFALRAGEAGQATITAWVSFEVHLGYPGPAYWTTSRAAAPLVITVSPPAQPNPKPAQATNQLDLGGASIRAWAWSPDGQTMALAGDKSVFLVDLADPQSRVELQAAAVEQVTSLAFSPDGQLLAVSISSGALQLWDLRQQNLIFALDDDPRVSYFRSLAFSPDGQRLAAGGVNSRSASSSDGIVRIINLDTHSEAASFEWYGWIDKVTFSPDGARLGLVNSTTCGRGGRWVSLVDPEHGLEESLAISTGGVDLAFSPDGALLAVGAQEGASCVPDGGYVWLWSLAQRQPAGVLPRFEDGPVVTFSPNSVLLAASDGQTLRLWGLNPIQEVMRLLPSFGHLGPVAFSPDGRVLAYQDGETIQFKELPPALAR